MRYRLFVASAFLLILCGVAFAAMPKDWIESTLGFEPDGGNGMIELFIAIVPIVAGLCLLAVAFLRSPRTERRTVAPSKREV